jgi:hypothetical protein
MKTQKRLLALFGAVVLLAGLVIQVVPPQKASAAQISARSLTLQAGASDGGSKAGGVVKHAFAFTVPSTSTAIGSIKFEYCTKASPTPTDPGCTTPTGLVTTSATLDAEGPGGATGFTLNATANGAPILTKATAATPAGANLSYTLGSVTNPTTVTPTYPNYTFFVRISTYNSVDGTGTATDTGTVTASTAEQIQLDGTMPESLVFCTGETISLTTGVPDCATATDGAITFNQLFSPTDTASATSQMAASTNAGFGYAISVNGPTLTSGSNTITAMSANNASVKGISQFGLNLKLNTTASTTTPLGAEVAPAVNGTNYTGRAFPTSPNSYATQDSFRFASGNIVADSNASGTDAQIYTVGYIVNVPGSQPAGTYVTTLTYICTPTF